MIYRLPYLLALWLWPAAAFAACPGGSTCLSGVPWTDTNASLKAISTATAAQMTAAYRAGYYAAGDGGDAFYTWNAASACTEDGGSCIAPNSGTGRWILNSNGAVSVKVFGARCDASTSDLVAFNKALAARSAVVIPADSTCAIRLASSNDSIILNTGNRLYGQSRETSRLEVILDFTPSYDFVAGGRFGPASFAANGNIVVASNVATVTTTWSHQLKAGQSAVLAGSATAGLNGTKTITAITAPNKFTFATSGVANGTYNDLTSLVAPSGIGVTVVRGFKRDDGNQNNYDSIELDHFSFRAIQDRPFTFIDLTGVWYSRVHDVSIFGGPSSYGQIGIVCADRTPANNAQKACFFNHIYDMTVAAGTLAHWSAADGNSGVNMWDNLHGGVRVFFDTSGGGNNGGIIMNSYVSGDGDANSWDWYPAFPAGSFMSIAGCENCGHTSDFSTESLTDTTSLKDHNTVLPGIVSLGGQLRNTANAVEWGGNIQRYMSTVFCTAPGQLANLPDPYSGNIYNDVGQVFSFRAFGAGATCVITPTGGKTLEGSSSPITLTAPNTVTIQWYPQAADWRIVGH
jgi:hypothetical protein